MILRPLGCLLSIACLVACGNDDPTGGGGSGAAGGNGGNGGETSTGGTGGTGAEGGAGPCPAGEGPLPDLQLVPFVDGLTMPIHMAPDPRKPGRYFVSERTGAVRVVEDGVVLETPLLDVSADVSCCQNDRGFFAIALHPNFVENGLFYVHYSRIDTPFDSTTVLAEYRISEADPLVADPEPVRTLIELAQNTVWHYGGTITFGPDGMLYYSRGDGGGEGDPEDDAQNPGNKYGKVMRIDVDTFPEPPPGNMPDADPFVWDLGLRNTWRMSFDSCTGDLYLGDVGQNSYEEVSVHLAGTGHQNFGWNMYEATHCFEEPCDPEGINMPLVEHAHTTGWCAVIGGYVYRGSAIPSLVGRYFYGDNCTASIMSFRLVDGVATDNIDHTFDLESFDTILENGMGSFAEDENGELYVTDMVGGVIYRIEAE
ncbi:MAG: hypothetical protein HOW73_29770 [Polyangiaceae bacterium]|nr:hypothetical protein [Polyangiaceae bacterium]